MISAVAADGVFPARARSSDQSRQGYQKARRAAGIVRRTRAASGFPATWWNRWRSDPSGISTRAFDRRDAKSERSAPQPSLRTSAGASPTIRPEWWPTPDAPSSSSPTRHENYVLPIPCLSTGSVHRSHHSALTRGAMRRPLSRNDHSKNRAAITWVDVSRID